VHELLGRLLNDSGARRRDIAHAFAVHSPQKGWMRMRGKITKRVVDALVAGGPPLSDSEIKGFVARRLPSGTVTYGYRYRDRGGRQRWLPLGLHGSITPDQAREFAKQRAGEVASGRDPAGERVEVRAAAAATVDTLLDDFLVRHVCGKLRSANEIERTFDVYVRPRLGDKSIYNLKRSDIVELLDEIEDKNGPVMADRTLAYVRKAFNWQATRDDSFTPPIVRGMARTKPSERRRTRILDDQEIRDLWTAIDDLKNDAPLCYPRFVRTLFYVAQRREEVSKMVWEEIEGDAWTIPKERSKNKVANVVPLTKEVRNLLGSEQTGFVFSNEKERRRAFSGFSKAKLALDRKIAELRKRQHRPPMPHWVHHDLRRTARSLMSRTGVFPDVAERVLGHVIPGVRGTYDRYEYFDEKRDALERLAALIERILHPSDAVVTFPKQATRG
jgi:integrase